MQQVTAKDYDMHWMHAHAYMHNSIKPANMNVLIEAADALIAIWMHASSALLSSFVHDCILITPIPLVPRNGCIARHVKHCKVIVLVSIDLLLFYPDAGATGEKGRANGQQLQ